MLRATFVSILALLAAGPVLGQPEHGTWTRVAELRGVWHFRIGDDPAWAGREVAPAGWDRLTVPGAWEDQGYPGYDGYAWYRRRVELPRRLKGRHLALHLGRIDDVDQVFVNGRPLGMTGRFPPDYETAFHTFRTYRLPTDLLRFDGTDVIAVRVFDERLEGGVLEGRIGIYERTDVQPFVADLTGLWLFRRGDQLDWAEEKIDETGWQPIMVPARWETQGHAGYDGYGWYRIAFYLPETYRGRPLTLLLGRIDDLDAAYVNGVLVGKTGAIGRGHIDGREWRRGRHYALPEHVLHYGGYNTIAVRVYDALLDGGIYEGPVGVVETAALERARAPGFWEAVRAWWFGKEPGR